MGSLIPEAVQSRCRVLVKTTVTSISSVVITGTAERGGEKGVKKSVLSQPTQMGDTGDHIRACPAQPQCNLSEI